MTNPENREMMAELYRIMEKHEVPPTDRKQYLEYFSAALADIQTFYRKWWDEKKNPFAHRMAFALYAALSDQCKGEKAEP
jgi:hypothetical protein